MEHVTLLEVNQSNLKGEGCYCLRSKPNSKGYKDKNSWLSDRFNEGIKYMKIMENGKQAGFIEFAPIEYSSRVVYGENYLVIHCLWVGITGKGYASTLIQNCLEKAREEKKAGVVVVTNSNTSWTSSKDVFIKNGFNEIDQAPYDFELLVYKLGDVTDPYFPRDWEERLQRFNELTIVQMPQCPYVEVAGDNVIQAANKLGIQSNIINLKNREQLLELSPTPYGIYGVIYKNQLISYHRLTMLTASKRLKELMD
ncbi:MAG TPA: GNAT family N-acetyltransferase [Ureibacillus sp.]|nr:GNAT family N-acetyltransferase [Ureibacillus sp.]